MAHYRICRETGKRSYPSKTAAHEAARSRRVKVTKCEHCRVQLRSASEETGPGYHVTR